MPNPFSKGWKYVRSSLDNKIEESADPKIQIRQAVDGAKERHQQVTQHAAEIIGRKKQLEIRIDRLLKSQADYQEQTKRALEMADSATDPAQAAEYNQAAEVIASQLVSVEQDLEEAKTQHAAAVQAAEQAQQQQKESEARLKEQLNQAGQLEAQADQAAMQEHNSKAMDSLNQFGGDDSVPTLDSVRAKIEQRYTNALGAQELHQAAGGDRIQEITSAGNDLKASARLDAIRAEMQQQKQLESGEPQAEGGEGKES